MTVLPKGHTSSPHDEIVSKNIETIMFYIETMVKTVMN